jgi:hypothetical protein
LFDRISLMAESVNQYFIKDGRGYVVRFFDCQDSRDLRDLVLIVESPGVQRWMDNVDDLNFGSYDKWMDEKGDRNTFLFAIADSREDAHIERRVHGFVYVYPSKILEHTLEISYAKRPGAPAGLTTPAIEVVCRIVYEYLKEKKPWMIEGLKIIAEIERGNEPSIRVVEKAGFKMIRDYDSADNALWSRNLEKTGNKGELYENLGRVRQLNGSFCGPATLQILLSHYGIEADQKKLVLSATTWENAIEKGLSKELLGKAINNSYPEMSFWIKNNADLADIEKMVRVYNYPVGVDWQGIFYEVGDANYPNTDITETGEEKVSKGDDGHYCVITDVDRTNDRIRMNDPYSDFYENDRFFKIREFENRWWDDRMDKNPDGSDKYVFEKRLMFVVVPKNVRLPEELGMTELI